MKTLHLVIVVLFFVCYCGKINGKTLLVVDDDPKIQEMYDRSVLLIKSNVEESKILIDSLINMGKASNNYKLLGECYYQLSMCQKAKMNLDEAKESAFKTIDFGDKLQDKKLITIGYCALGDIARLNSKFDECIEHFEKALTYTNDSLKIMEIYADLGLPYTSQSKFPTAIQYYMDALKMMPVDAPKMKRGVIYNSIGSVFRILKEYGKAAEYYNKALKLLDEKEDAHYYVIVLNGLANIAIENGDYESAISNYKKTLSIREEKRDSFGMTFPLYGLGTVYKRMKKYILALEYYNKSLKIEKALGAKYEAMTSLHQIAMCYEHLKDYKKAKSILLEAIEISKEIKRPWETTEIQESTLIIELSLLGKTDILNLYKEMSVNRDSLSKKRNFEHISDLEAKYTKAIDQQQIAEQDLLIQKEQSNSQKKTFGLIGLGLFIPFLIGGISWNRKKRNEIHLLNRELSHRVKNNLEFISSLLHLQSRELEDAGTKEALLDSENRIQALSAVYKRLYGDDGVIPINLQEYLTELTENLKDTFDHKTNDLDIQLTAHELLIEPEKATKIGLIINELVTNSIKYAFKEEANPIISVEFKKEQDQLHLKFSDNGSGLASKDNGTNKSFGIGLIEKLVKQLNGKMKYKNENGLSYDFSFKGL